MSITPNLGMTLPDPSVTPGPAWASQLNTALGLIDSHNHAPGSGSLIGTAGIRVDADFDFASFNAFGLRTIRVSDQTSITIGSTDRRAVYSKSGDLYYVNSAGAEVQITSGSSVAGATGSITGLTSPASAVYSSITGGFSFNKDSSKPGKLAISEISIYEYDNAAAAPITIKSPASVGASYSLTLPTAVPASARFVSVDTAGAMSYAGGSLLAADGSVGTPSLSFASDTDTGIYRSGTNQLTLVAAGAVSAVFSSGTVQVTSGAVGSPSLAFVGDASTGFYRIGTSDFAAVVGGVQAQRWNAQTTFIRAGTLGNPALVFDSDADTGFYRPSANNMTFVAGGTSVLDIGAAGTTLRDDLATAMTPQVYTGSVSGGSFTDVTINRGGALTWKAVFGSYINSGGGRVPIGYGLAEPGSGTSLLNFATGSGTSSINTVRVVNGDTVSRNFTIVVFV